jgi:hypothetical protein
VALPYCSLTENPPPKAGAATMVAITKSAAEYRIELFPLIRRLSGD